MKDPICWGVGIALVFIGAAVFVRKLYDDPIYDDPIIEGCGEESGRIKLDERRDAFIRCIEARMKEYQCSKNGMLDKD